MKSAPGSNQSVNILLVDDQADSLLALEAVLTDLGQNLVKARSGAEALRHLLTQTFAVIILDVQMPGMNGYDLAALIRERDSLRHTPIIFLTAVQTGDAQVFQGYAAGAVDYLFKPVAPEILRSKVAVFIELGKKNQLLEDANRRMTLDIQRRRFVEAALRDSEEKFRSVAETAKDAIVSADRHGCVTYFNGEAERMFGYKSAEIAGQPLTILMPERYRDAHLRGLVRFLSTGKSHVMGRVLELTGLRKDGGEFPIDLSLASWKRGRDIYFSAIIRDVTERKHLERGILEVSEREQQRFAQDLHDGLFQHLKGIAYMINVLGKKLSVSSEEDARTAAKIEDLVNQAIVAGRGIARGMSPLVSEANSLMSALQELASNTSRLFDISCVFECPAPVLSIDLAAALHVYRITQEAVNNAVKHSGAKHIWISLNRDDQGHITLAVRDDGTGFTPHPTTDGGMGIDIMQYRARMIGAALDIRRAAEGGTVVDCVLRDRIPDDAPAAAARAEHP